MVDLKLLNVLIWSCIAYGSSALDNEKLISEHLIPFEHKQDLRLDTKRSTENTLLLNEVSNSDYSGSLHKRNRNAFKSILSGLLVKQRLATDRLVHGANIYSQQIPIPISHHGAFSADQVTSPDKPNPLLIPVPYKSFPLCEPAYNPYVNGIHLGIPSEGILIKNQNLIPCITPQSHVILTKNPGPLNTIIKQNLHLIPLTTSTNFKLTSSPLISNDYGYNPIFPNNLIIPTYSDSIMQRNTSQIQPYVSNIQQPCDSPSKDNIDSTYNEPLGSPPCPESPIEDEHSIIPKAPALLPLNPPNVVFPPSYNSFREEEGNDIHVDGSAGPELSDCHQPSISANDQPLIIPEAPALQPLNPPNTIFYPTNSNLNDEANEEKHRGDLSDPCPQFATANMVNDEPIALENSDSVVPPSPPAYFPLNPPNNNNSPGFALSDEYSSNTFSDNSESSDHSPCPESIENQPIIIPEAPAFMPLNPPNSPIYPADSSFDKDENELSDSPPYPQISTQFVPEDEASPLPDIPIPPSYFPLNSPDIQLPANTLDEYESNINLGNSAPLHNLPCPQDTHLHEEPIEDLPIIPEAPALMPLNPPNIPSDVTDYDKEINEETSQPIPTPPSYFPLNPPETPIKVIDNDLPHIISSENNKTPLEYPFPQTNLPSVIEEMTPLPLIPHPPSYIPLNPPETLQPASDEHGILETTPSLETSNIKVDPLEDIPKNAPKSVVPVNQPVGIVLQQQMTNPAIFHSPKVILIPEKFKEIRALKGTVFPNLAEYDPLDLPPCDPETSEYGIKSVIFEPKRCRKAIKVAIPTTVVRQPIRKRKILVKKRPTTIIKSAPRPILIRKLKKSHVLRKQF